MSTQDTNPTNDPTNPRPLGYWLRAVERHLDSAMDELFADEGITRRDWRRLNLIAGTVTDPRMSERLAKRPERIAALAERGWVSGEPGAWRLTETGEAARAALSERVAALRAQVAGAVSAEDFATTIASLETIARSLGWTEGERMPRGRSARFDERRGGRGGRPHGYGHGREYWHGSEHAHDHEHRSGYAYEHGRGDCQEHGRGRRPGHHAPTEVHVHVHLDGRGADARGGHGDWNHRGPSGA